NTITWDGLDNSGTALAAGSYSLKLTAFRNIFRFSTNLEVSITENARDYPSLGPIGSPTPSPTETLAASPTPDDGGVSMARVTGKISSLNVLPFGMNLIAYPNPAKTDVRVTYRLNSASKVRIDLM